MSKKRGRPRKAKPNVSIENFETVEMDDTTCGMCFAEFLDPEDLQLHFEQVHGNLEGLINCPFCILKFPDSERLAFHIRNEHIKTLSVCQFCVRCFLKSEECAAHEKLHITPVENIHSCSNCNETFRLIKELELHELKMHPDCNGVFLHKYYPLLSSVLNVQVETFLKSLGTDTAYVCQKCTYSNSDLDRYLNHLKKSNCRSEACEKCCFVYRNVYMLSRHIMKNKSCMHGNKESDSDMFKKCPKCNQNVFHALYTEHKNKCKAVQCHHCDIVLPSGIDFTEHYSKSHPKSIAVHSCKYCSKYFFGETAMKKHFDRLHKAELHLYKYKCNDCNMIFKHPKLLFSHFLRLHPDVQPFTCKICDKSFRVRRYFTIHIKVEHKSIGNVKFTDKFHVVFEEKRTTDDDKTSNNENAENKDKTELTNEILSADGNDTENANSEPEDDDKVAKKKNTVQDSEEDPVKVKESTNTTTRKPKGIKRKPMVEFLESDSDDEPLVKIARKKPNKKPKKPLNKRELTCNICNKNCYTILNYKQHVAMHKKNQSKFCIKCNASFRSVQDLKSHYATVHSNSALTDTLKRLLEKRKSFETQKKLNASKPENMSEKFRNTIKKVEFKKSDFTATVTEIKTDNSEQLPAVNNKMGKEIKINTSLTIRKVNPNTKKPLALKIYKFKPPKPLETTVKLAMPTKCHFSPISDENKATIKLISNTPKQTPPLHFTDGNEYILPDNTFTYYTDYDDHHEASNIPEVAQEVMLDATGRVEAPKSKFTHRIIIPNVTDSSGYENIRIAHLLPEAPYYKIVTVKDILQTDEKTKHETEAEEVSNVIECKIELPSGTKLVNVNPLAHLLKNKFVLEDETPKVKRVYRKRDKKPKKEVTKNYEQEVAKALLKLEKTASIKREKKKRNRSNIPPGNYRAEITLTHDILDQSAIKPSKQQNKWQRSQPKEMNRTIEDKETSKIDDEEPTEIEYLEEFDDIVEKVAGPLEKAEFNLTEPGLSLPEL